MVDENIGPIGTFVDGVLSTVDDITVGMVDGVLGLLDDSNDDGDSDVGKDVDDVDDGEIDEDTDGDVGVFGDSI